jgi:pimeloyl-ACP methyl ester carboxylesterase
VDARQNYPRYLHPTEFLFLKGGTTVVFIHGWSCDRSYWKEQVDFFATQFQVVTIDLAGHGESGAGRQVWTIDSFGEDVAAVIKELDLKRVILVGHSMGGDVIVSAALRVPERIKGLVWVDVYKQLKTFRSQEQIDTFVSSFENNFQEKAEAFVRSMFPDNAEKTLVDRVAKDMSSAPTPIALGAMKSSISNDRKITVGLNTLKLPVVAINPSDPATDMESMNAAGVDVVLMPDVGHFLMMEKPEEFNVLLFRVLEKLNI